LTSLRAYFENAIRWMRAQPWLRDGFLAVWEYSRGRELALLFSATFSWMTDEYNLCAQHWPRPSRATKDRATTLLAQR